MSFPFVQPYFGLGNSLQTAQGAAGGGGVGGWVELARTTLGSASSTIDVTSLADKRYLMVLYDLKDTGVSLNPYTRLNSDTGSNYSSRYTSDGVSDSTLINNANGIIGSSKSSASEQFGVGYFANYATKEKLSIQHWVIQATSGATTAPSRGESVGKHAQTSNPISSINFRNGLGGNMASGSECVVLGWDPADTHTTNFWEELASVELSSAGDDLSSGTISGKRYLWVQAYAKATGGNINNGFRFNSDTGSNYANRRSVDGAADATQTSTSSACDDANLDSAYERYYNMFIVNNSSNEKLAICHVVQQNAAGAANAPRRGEFVGKWANTSNQITEITLHNFSGGNLDSGSIIKVWGAD